MAVVTVVVPVYYNAASLPTLAERLAALAGAHPQDQFEFIYVDDGSGEFFAVLRTLRRRASA
jgi:hypothetical protein